MTSGPRRPRAEGAAEEFHRLASVRARRSRRHRGAVVTTIVAAAALVALSWPVALRLHGPSLRNLAPPALALIPTAFQATATQGEARGSVTTVEAEGRVVHVSSGFLGLLSIPLVVTPETVIVVGDKEGGFGDIRPGERVIAAYEIRERGPEATRIELVPRPRAEE